MNLRLIVGLGTTRFIRSGSFADSCAAAAHADASIVSSSSDFIFLAHLALLLPEWRHLEQGCGWCLLALLALLAFLLAPRALVLALLVRSVGQVGDRAAALGG
jgi:energy-converting hydrogenase Eha subunit G